MLFGKSERFDDNISSQVCNTSINGYIEESSFSDCTTSPVCGVDNTTTGRKTKEIEITSPGPGSYHQDSSMVKHSFNRLANDPKLSQRTINDVEVECVNTNLNNLKSRSTLEERRQLMLAMKGLLRNSEKLHEETVDLQVDQQKNKHEQDRLKTFQNR